MQNDLEFVEDGHIYLVAGHRIPSVTQIIRHFIPTFYKGSNKMDIGTKVHYAAELYDKGVLDWGTVDEKILPFVTAWVDFCEHEGFKSILIEEKMSVHMPKALFSYAGKCDRIGAIGDDIILLDIKTGTKTTTGSLQTALYSLLYSYHVLDKPLLPPKIDKRCVVYLKQNGKYTIEWHIDQTEDAYAKDMVCLYNWFLAKKLIKD